jgi:hypothetical protein
MAAPRPAAPQGLKEHKSGWLRKRARAFPHVWQKRFFLLDEQSLTYFTKKGTACRLQLLEWIDVRPGRMGEFEVHFSGTSPDVFPERRIMVRANTSKVANREAEAREWASAIAAARQQLDLRGNLGTVSAASSHAAPTGGLVPPPLMPPLLAPPLLAPPPLAPPPLPGIGGPPPPPRPPPPPPPPAGMAGMAGMAGSGPRPPPSSPPPPPPMVHAAAAPKPDAAPLPPPTPGSPAAPTVVSFEEGVRRQLRKKSNVVLAERREDVLALLSELNEKTFPTPSPRPRVWVCLRVPPPSPPSPPSPPPSKPVAMSLAVRFQDDSLAVVGWFEGVSARLESFHLPLECEKDETWGSRLAIAKKGGGMHYSDEERGLADVAYGRVSQLYEYVTASRQLSAKAEQLPRLASTLAIQKALTTQQKLVRMATAQRQTIELLERLGAPGPLATWRRRCVEQGRLPDTLPVSLRLATLGLAAMLMDVLDLADEEHHHWGREPTAAKKRFRTPRTHQILHAALEIATQQRDHPVVRAVMGARPRAHDLARRINELAERERALSRESEAALAALAADDYDEAV